MLLLFYLTLLVCLTFFQKDNLALQMERFFNPLDLSRTSILIRAERKTLERGDKPWKVIGRTVFLVDSKLIRFLWSQLLTAPGFLLVRGAAHSVRLKTIETGDFQDGSEKIRTGNPGDLGVSFMLSYVNIPCVVDTCVLQNVERMHVSPRIASVVSICTCRRRPLPFPR